MVLEENEKDQVDGKDKQCEGAGASGGKRTGVEDAAR